MVFRWFCIGLALLGGVRCAPQPAHGVAAAGSDDGKAVAASADDGGVQPMAAGRNTTGSTAGAPGRDAGHDSGPRPAAGSSGPITMSDPRDSGLPADAAMPPAAAADSVTFHNGGFWNDATGKRIEAHGGGFVQAGDTFYWFGEDKSANSANFKAVNCYASSDLVHWQFRRAVVTRSTAPELDVSDRIIERPKVIYNERTQQYVMWLHWEGKSYAEAKAGVLSSATVDGAYTFHSAFRPNGNMSRDDTLFRDDDGRAYFLSAANENADLVLYELSDDYLGIARQVATLFAGQKREAPALFKDRGRYYLITSAATGWDPNQAKYASATAIAGPWSALQNLGDATTYDTQSAYVLPIRGSARTTYLYAGDRWQDPDLASSKYIWLPLRVSDAGQLGLDYYTDWQLNLTTGAFSADDGYLPQQGWKLVHADSEETAVEDGRAPRAFDGSPSTFWHTQYTNTAPMPPHELQIDLGARYALDALRYLPRQDGSDHGMVASYEFYVSDDPKQWNAPVAKGTFAADHQSKRVEFPRTVGRYVRFSATSEVNGKPWTSVAELDVAGEPQ